MDNGSHNVVLMMNHNYILSFGSLHVGVFVQMEGIGSHYTVDIVDTGSHHVEVVVL